MKGIIMTSNSVRAILTGEKTQTRRVVKGLNPNLPFTDYIYDGVQEKVHAIEAVDKNGKPTEHYHECKSPIYFPGDTVYVKESWGIGTQLAGTLVYRTDYLDKTSPLVEGYEWHSPMYMPQDVARIFLRITDLRVERIQSISDEDCIAEGCNGEPCDHGGRWACEDCNNTGWVGGMSPRVEYMILWDEINANRDCGAYAWDKNPLVWVYEFERVDKAESIAADK
jgi:hypothetical protein